MITKTLKTNTTKYFYRIEYKKTGQGFYEADIPCLEDELSNMVSRHQNHLVLPNAINDDKIFLFLRFHPYISYRFCFNSKKDMDRLIKKREMKILIKNDCAVYRIKSSYYYSSKYQTIIDKDKIIDKVDISYYYD